MITGILTLTLGIDAAATPSFLQQGPRAQAALLPSLIQKETGTCCQDPLFKLVNKTSIQQIETSACLCPIGSFWHWRIHSCVKQGSWGYECGFFPGEHHHRVCMDGLKCEPVQNAPDVYIYHGKFQGTAGSFPASCRKCGSDDSCKVGEERHNEECLAAVDVTGEACATVRVTVPSVEATAEATKQHTATVDASKNDYKATGTASAEFSATATKTATGVAEATACVTIPEVKEELGIKNVSLMGAVVAQEIVSKGDEMAFDRASKLAMAAAKQQGLLDATDAARQAAEAMAAEKARLEAERLAAEAAAWKAEAGANEKAQQAADARAKALADEQAKAAAKEAAAREAAAQAARDAAAKAEADALAAEAAAEKAALDAAAKAEADALANAARETASQAKAQANAAEEQAAEAEARMTKEKQPPKEPETKNMQRKITDEEHAATLP